MAAHKIHKKDNAKTIFDSTHTSSNINKKYPTPSLRIEFLQAYTVSTDVETNAIGRGLLEAIDKEFKTMSIVKFVSLSLHVRCM